MGTHKCCHCDGTYSLMLDQPYSWKDSTGKYRWGMNCGHGVIVSEQIYFCPICGRNLKSIDREI